MLGIIFVLMIGMVLIGVLEGAASTKRCPGRRTS